MISLISHIEYLLSEHDCVIVPGWGAFIGQYSSSHENLDYTVMMRPRKTVAFNGALTYNDGLLVMSIMRKSKLSYEQALSIVEQSVTSLRQQLAHEGEVSFGKLGFFNLNSDGALAFESFATPSNYDEFFGLLPVNIKPLTELSQEKEIEDKPEVVETRNFLSSIKRDYLQIAASIALLIGLAFVLTTPVSNNENQNYASINTFDISKPTIDRELTILLPKEAAQQTTVSRNDEKVIVKSDSIKDTAKTLHSDKNSEELTGKSATTHSCYLIVASLNTEQQAKKFVEEQKNPKYKILNCGTKYRVYARSGSMTEMSKAMKEISSTHSDAWIYKH